MNIILWIIFGGIAGWIASMIAGTNREMGLLANVIVGIIGAVVGGFLMGVLTGDDYMNTFSLGSLVVAVVGAVILLAAYKAFRGGSRGPVA